MSTVPEFRSIAKEIEEFATSLWPYFEKLLFLLFFGLLFALGHYCLLLIGSAEMDWRGRGVCFGAAVWSIFNIVFNYLMTIIVSPGTPTDIPAGLLVGVGHSCRRCGVTKPPRTHHCSICKRCVLQMDHHCPWVGNCVGHHNRKYFMNFLTYMTLGLAEMLGFLSPHRSPMNYALVLTLLICLALFTVYHWYIVLKGKTSLQICWQDPRYTPSSSFSHNLRLVYGTANILSCLCPSVAVLRNPGHQWQAA